jgi:hypothetical protein
MSFSEGHAMPRGRPTKSIVRERLIEILQVCKRAYGYQLFKYYLDLYPAVTMRNVYYHLRKGVALGELQVERIEQSKGDFSWGPDTERTYYKLGDLARPQGDKRVEDYFAQRPTAPEASSESPAV